MDRIHIGVLAYLLASGWLVIRLLGAYRVDTKRVWSATVRTADPDTLNLDSSTNLCQILFGFMNSVGRDQEFTRTICRGMPSHSPAEGRMSLNTFLARSMAKHRRSSLFVCKAIAPYSRCRAARSC